MRADTPLAAPVIRSSAPIAPTGNEPTAPATAQSDETNYEIPAFLRRQAN